MWISNHLGLGLVETSHTQLGHEDLFRTQHPCCLLFPLHLYISRTKSPCLHWRKMAQESSDLEWIYRQRIPSPHAAHPCSKPTFQLPPASGTDTSSCATQPIPSPSTYLNFHHLGIITLATILSTLLVSFSVVAIANVGYLRAHFHSQNFRTERETQTKYKHLKAPILEGQWSMHQPTGCMRLHVVQDHSLRLSLQSQPQLFLQPIREFLTTVEIS